MHKQQPQTAYRKDAVLIGTMFENCDKQKRTSPIAFIGEVRSCFIQRMMPPTAFLISALFRYIAASASMNSSSTVMVRPACMA